MLSRRFVLAGLAGSLVAPRLAAAAVPTPVSRSLIQGAIGAGFRINGNGRNTLVEFFDYNCIYCRSSARDIAALLSVEPSLNYVLVNYGVLGQPSAEAARVAIAYGHLYGSSRYLAFHQALFRAFGSINGERALAEVERQGGDRGKVAELAQSAAVAARAQAGLRTGKALGLLATPSFVINGKLFHGEVGLALKRSALAQA